MNFLLLALKNSTSMASDYVSARSRFHLLLRLSMLLLEGLEKSWVRPYDVESGGTDTVGTRLSIGDYFSSSKVSRAYQNNAIPLLACFMSVEPW